MRSVNAAVEHDGNRVGVVPEVDELFVGIAIVGVDGHQPGLEHREHRLEVLGPVVEVLRDLVLLRGAGVEQRAGHAVGPTIELGPGDLSISLPLRERIGQLASTHFPDFGEVPT